MTLYLKYRPQKIADLDLVEVGDMLSKLLASSDLPHAFLFSGPRGTGKTSSARIVAKAINCTKPKNSEPCGECDACLSITGGFAPDVIEIDAASNRGIDEIRTLRDNIKLAPMALKYKVYIIDEVHMLTTEAANALLKTLEEPPAHAIFILCTTDPHKLPETVVSRCTRINFKMPSLAEAVGRLNKIVEGEKLDAEKAALQLIAEAGRGSFRDEVKILEQIAGLSEKITEAGVRKVLGLLESADPQKFIDLWRGGDSDAALAFIQNLVESGVTIRDFIERVAHVLRQELLTTKSGRVILELQQLDMAYDQTKTSVIPQLPLEIMVIGEAEASPKAKPSQAKPDPIAPAKENKKASEVVEEKALEEAPVPARQTVEAKGKYSLADIKTKWPEILLAVRPKNHSVEALLRSTSPMEFDGQDLTLEVFYKFHKDKLETDKCRAIIEEAVQTIFNTDRVRLKLKLGQKAGREEVTGQHVEEDILKAAADIFKVEVV